MILSSKKIIYILLAVFLSFPSVSFAASDDFTADGDITVSGISFNSTVVDMTIGSGSQAESWTINSGVFTVTNPGSFQVSCSSSSVKSLVVSQGGSNIDCELNTVPGTSSTTLPTASGTYTVTPSTATVCAALCDVISGASAYNAFPTCGASACSADYTLSGSGSGAGCCAILSHTAAYHAYPTCGAASCDSGYVVSGSGANAICVAASSGGGGGGGSPYSSTPSQPSNAEITQTSLTTTDGTVINTETTITKANGIPVVSELTADITPNTEMSDTKILSLDTSKTSAIAKVDVSLPAVVLQDIARQHTGEIIKVSVISREASNGQKTNTARSGKFLIGFDVFDIGITAAGDNIETLSSPITLTFEIKGLNYGEDVKVYYFDDRTGTWEIAGNGGSISDGKITVAVDHLTIFGLLFSIATVSAKEETDPRVLQMHRIYDEANIVYRSGTSLNDIVVHNKTAVNSPLQAQYMEKYTAPIIKEAAGLATAQIYAINNFIVYGTESTRILGAGERAGVVNSYKKAFGKVPRSEEEWKDVIAIGNGRWPGETSQAAENKAKEEFKKIYLRDAGMGQPNDNAAVTVMAYGLRPANRNMASEAAAIRIFKGIFKYNPVSALDWDAVRAIAYSGAIR